MYGLVDRLARFFALAGGFVLSILIVMTCASVLGRGLNTFLHAAFMQTHAPGLADALLSTGIGPINGDFELVEAGVAFSIFAFIPLCQLNGAHASVDIFTAGLSRRLNRFLLAVIEAVFAAVMVLIAWQLLSGTISKYQSGQVSFLLQFPVWWAYAFSMTGAAAAAIVAVYVAGARIAELVSGSIILPPELGADH